MSSLNISLLLHPFVDHWRGRVGLWPLILINLLGLTLALNFLLERVAGSPVWIVVTLAVFCCAIVPIWQAVGLIRACNLHLIERGDNVLPWVGYATLLIVLLMTASQTVGTVLSLERFNPPAGPAAGVELLPLSQDGSAAQLSGEIDYETLAALSKTIEAYPALSRLVLTSKGGLIYAARAIAQIVEARGTDTHVPSFCNSACTLIFAAGARRTLSEDAKLGFHRYGKLTKHHILMVDPLVEQKKDVAYLRGRGISEDFLNEVYQADNNSIWYPERARLQEAGFLTE